LFRQSASYRRIAAHLRRGGLIAYPTESCYGLGCDPDNRSAVQRLLRLKQRPQHKGLILIAAHYHQVARYLQTLTHDEQAKLKKDGAHAITYLMPARPSCPRWLRGAHDTLAVRSLPQHGQRAGLDQRQPQRTTSRQDLCAMPASVRAQGVGIAGARRHTQETIEHPRMG
jgi:tRNA threonylcarbamoyl adenosine modification protein (Sua5/YciO/YrdC/YwlC family)